MANKSRVLYLLRYLQCHSDEDHPVSTGQKRLDMGKEGWLRELTGMVLKTVRKED